MAMTNGRAPSAETQRDVEQFLYHQAELLDARSFEAWADLFTKDGTYWMPASEDQTVADGQPNIFYEDFFLMRMRIKRITHVRAHSQRLPNRTSHVVSNTIIEAVDGETGDVVVRSKFYASEFRNDALRHFAGKYRHDLQKTDDGYRIRQQRVDLVNAEGPWEYVLQTWL